MIINYSFLTVNSRRQPLDSIGEYEFYYILAIKSENGGFLLEYLLMFRMLLRLTGYVFVYFLGAATVIFVPNFREKVVALFKESSKKAIKLFETAGDATVEAISKLAIESSGGSEEGAKSVEAPKKEEVKSESPTAVEKSKSVAVKKEEEVKPESPSVVDKSKSVAVKKEEEATSESPSAEESSVADKKEEGSVENTEDRATKESVPTEESSVGSTDKDNKS